MRCTAALSTVFLLAAQEPRFDVQSRLVLIPVTVTDPKGRFVDGLEAPDFLVLDNGQPRKVIVDSFATGVAPISLVIAVQSAGISAPVLDKVRKIGAMIQPLITGERGCAALVAFAARVHWLQDCTSDQDALASAFLRLQPGEDRTARMLDAASEAIARLRARPNVRRVLLLISESRDRGSEAALDAVVSAAAAAGVSVYAATYSAYITPFTSRPSGGPEPQAPELPRSEQRADLLGAIGELGRLGKVNTTQVLARETGGATFSFTRQKGLENSIEKLGAELHAQYVLSFVPDPAEPGSHSLEVRITRPGDYRIRFRGRVGF